MASMHAHWNGSQPHTATRARVLVIGREGSLYFGAPDGQPVLLAGARRMWSLRTATLPSVVLSTLWPPMKRATNSLAGRL